jgi:hypothetical protein
MFVFWDLNRTKIKYHANWSKSYFLCGKLDWDHGFTWPLSHKHDDTNVASHNKLQAIKTSWSVR